MFMKIHGGGVWGAAPFCMKGAAGRSVIPNHCDWACCGLCAHIIRLREKPCLNCHTVSMMPRWQCKWRISHADVADKCKDISPLYVVCLINIYSNRTGLKIWCWTTGHCLTATLASGLPSWRHTFCIITLPCTFRRCWRSSALPTCWLPRVWERNPSITTSPLRPSVHSPGQHRCEVQRGPLALPAARPHASLPRRRFHRRAWWSEPLRMPSKIW